MSRASCAPPNIGRPSATTSRRRPSCTSGAFRSESLHHVGGHPGAAFASGGSALESKNPLPQHSSSGARCAMMTNHVDRYERQEGGAGGGGAKATPGTSEAQSDKKSWKGWLREPIQLLDRSETLAWPSHCPPWTRNLHFTCTAPPKSPQRWSE